MSKDRSTQGYGSITNTVLVAGSNKVIWRPYADIGAGYVTTWAEAVAAVNAVTGPTTIQIEADPWEDNPVVIPGGYWALNDTTIVGTVTYAHGGQNWGSNNFWGDSIGDGAHRGAQIMLQVFTEGYQDECAAKDRPCRLSGVRGLKDMFSPIDSADVSTDKPSEIVVSGSGENNDGTFCIREWIDENTVTYHNCEATVETGLCWHICRINTVFFYNEAFGQYGEFTLDNVDFRNGGAQKGSFFVGYHGRLFIRLKNGASIRWYNIFGNCGAKLVVQSDGSPCWVGNYAFFGDGHVKFYNEPGMEFHDNQDINYQTYNSIIWFTPEDGNKWNISPVSVQGALNELASRIRSLENP